MIYRNFYLLDRLIGIVIAGAVCLGVSITPSSAGDKAVFVSQGEVLVVDQDTRTAWHYAIDSSISFFNDASVSPTQEYAAIVNSVGAWVLKLAADAKPVKLAAGPCLPAQWSKDGAKLTLACISYENQTYKLSSWMWFKDTQEVVEIK